MKLNNWHIMKDSDGGRHYLYGPLSDFDDEVTITTGEKYSDLSEIPFEEWSARDCSEVLANLMEDNNMHTCTYIPDIVCSVCEQLLSSEEQDKFMREFLLKMTSRYSL